MNDEQTLFQVIETDIISESRSTHTHGASSNKVNIWHTKNASKTNL